MTARCVKAVLTLVVGALFVPAELHAQAIIAGTVRDTSAGVLPGVTVEAASPALIERVRVAVSDGTGQYRIENLRPGAYTMTFTLPGFSTVRRQDIEITGSATVSINVEMKVGAIEETIVVTGAQPLVDVQSATRQSVVTRDVITAVPTAGGYEQILRLAPGIIGGAKDISVGGALTTFSAHGAFGAGRANQDGRIHVDGLLISVPQGTSSMQFTDTRNAEEITVTMAGGLGESDTAGPVLNMVPRTGSNVLSTSLYADWMNRRMQGDNLTDTLIAAGATAATPLITNYDVNVAVGGPIRKDRFWFFGTARQQFYRQAADMFYNKNAGDPTKWTYEPDFSRQLIPDVEVHNFTLRLTTQVTRRNKLSLFWDEAARCKQCEAAFAPLQSPEATRRGEMWPIETGQVRWTSTLSDRLLADFGFGSSRQDWGSRAKQNPYTGDLVRVTEQCTAGCSVNGNIPGLTFRSQSNSLSDSGRNQNYVFSWKATISYVTGSRTFKAGYTGNLLQDARLSNQAPNNLTYRVNNGVPNQVTMFINDYPNTNFMRADGFFVQQGWTAQRLTVQGALRFDIAQAWAPEQEVGPARFMPQPILFPRTPIVDSYKDLTPRASASYDLFGDGKTALKASWGMYLESTRTGGPYAAGNPTSRIVQSVSRTWTDANGNFTTDCDLLNPNAQDLRASGGDFCGAFSNRNFGTSTFSNTVDPDLVSGWGVRPADRQLTISVQREVLPRVSLDVGYVRRSFQHFMVTDNLAVGRGDFDQFSVTAPLDSRLPNGGGYTIAGLYNVKPQFFGLVDNLVTLSDKYGSQYAVFNGVDLSVNARLRNLTIQGGSNWGRTTTDNCEVKERLPEIDPLNPYCHVVSGYLAHFKAAITYIVPRVDVQLGMTFLSRPGITVAGTGTPVGSGSLGANYAVSNAVVRESLGRDLAGNLPNITVNLLEPGTVYGNRLNELNLRIGKIFRLGKARTNIGVDIFNLLNAAPVLDYNESFIPGGRWLSPLTVMKARFVKIGAQFDF